MQSRNNDKNPFYINERAPRYIVTTPDITPLIYTRALSYCVAIGFVYKEKATVKKFALYHSYSEHTKCSEDDVKSILARPAQELFTKLTSGRPDNLIHAVKNFITDIKDFSGISIIISVNPKYNDATIDFTNIDNSYEVVSIKQLFNCVCKCLSIPEIKNYIYHRGGYDFYLFNDGNFSSTPIYHDLPENEQLARRIALFIAANIGDQAQVTTNERLILHEVDQAQNNQRTWLNACKNIYTIVMKAKMISNYLTLFDWGQSASSKQLKLTNYGHMLEAVCDPIQQQRAIYQHP